MQTLKEAREAKGVKQVAVADHIGVSRQTYSRYESNPETLSIGQAKAICDFLGYDVRDFFSRTMLIKSTFRGRRRVDAIAAVHVRGDPQAHDRVLQVPREREEIREVEAIKTERGRVPAGKHRTRPAEVPDGTGSMLTERTLRGLSGAAGAVGLTLTLTGILPTAAASALAWLLDPIPGWAFVSGLCALVLGGAAWVWRAL